MADSTPLNTDISNEVPVPPIAAAFLVNFDHRKGYTLEWHRSIDGVQVEGVVEFKSLPSGLHNVEEDLIYFIHEDYAGLSAFVNQPDEQSERRARMLAIGVLVPLDYGRIGRSWRHAEGLKELARSQMKNMKDSSRLEEFWNKYRIRPETRATQTPSDSSEYVNKPHGYRKSRSMSTATTYFPSTHHLTPHHPATTILESVKLFGPLLFPLYRAALLRKRILIITEAPVEFSCNLGISDIPLLKQQKSITGDTLASSDGWIACTTDDVLGTKPDLYDVLVLMPSSESRPSGAKVFPRIINSTAALKNSFPKVGIKSTRRDFHRYVHLQQGLGRFHPNHLKLDRSSSIDDETSSLTSQSSSYSAHKAVVEPSSWSRMAYTSLVWWASAGDRRGGLADVEEMEMQQDSRLLQNDDDEEQIREVALVAFFHHMTSTIFETIAGAIERANGLNLDGGSYHDDPDSDGSLDETSVNGPAVSDEDDSQALLASPGQDREVEITQEEMTAMGLDSWSTSDKRFVEDLVNLWWNRKATVRALSIECCGLQIL